MRILLIEDEKKTAAFLTKGLREAGFTVEVARDGEKGLELARATRHDLLIVDVMLPKKDGWAVVAQLRVAGLHLTAKEFLLLAHLARFAGEVVSRAEIVEQVWDINFETETNVVDVMVRRLRAKVDDPFKTKLIHTVRGAGYVLKA